MTAWVDAVSRVVRAIPRGKTLGYGQVALLAGKPGAARAVVRALYAADGLPWWRVTRSDGTLAPDVAKDQARRLRHEGVKVEGRKLPATALSAPRRKTPGPERRKPA